MANQRSHADSPALSKAASKGNVALGCGVALVATILYFIAFAERGSVGWNAVLNSIAASLTAALLFTLADYLLSRRDYAQYIEQLGNMMLTEIRSLEFQSNAVSNARDLGLVQVFTNDRNDECMRAEGKLIREAASLTLLMNAGASWVEMHRESFRSRFGDQEKSTTIFMPSPASDFSVIQARKEEMNADALINRQIGVIRKLDGLSPRGGDRPYTVIGHQLFHPCLLILTDTDAIIAPYYASKGRKVPPAMWFKKTKGGSDYYSRLRDDVRELEALADSAEILPWFDEQMRGEVPIPIQGAA
ncbi:hypothetical protein ACGFZP_01060 [Kitasatospora sp. NPDC048239]|uniref:hypothetical protein n=1 Tax=Kitasatospora sp. NPDC048239 TaxID=3364046 RepID=UPI0037135DFF